MCTRQQWNIAVFHCQCFDRINQVADFWQNHRFTCFFQHQSVRGVVDVFRCTSKVNELVYRVQFWHASNFLFQEVLNRFYVVVSRALDLFDAKRVFFTEVGGDIVQELVCFCTECWYFLDRVGGRQFLQPTDFNDRAVL